MYAKVIIVISSIIALFITCSNKNEMTETSKLRNVQELKDFYLWLVSESETYYDSGTGHFGQQKFAYRNVLNECYLRFDGYQIMQNTDFEKNQWISVVEDDIIDYYKVIADITGGVWGFPAEINHPEFGDGFKYEINAGNSINGWIKELSGDVGSKAGIYYVHGQVLSDISKTYNRYKDKSLLKYIENGANRIINKNYKTGNVNYFAAALKGLSYAYAATKNENAKTKAFYYLSGIMAKQNKNGSFGGKHDQEAGYHGITLSCLAVARKYLPESEMPANFDTVLTKAIEYLRQLKDITIEDRAAFVVQAWYYLSCLKDDGIIREFTSLDWNCYSEAIDICIRKKQELLKYKQENNYLYQKGIQTFSLVASTIFKHYYNQKVEYY